MSQPNSPPLPLLLVLAYLGFIAYGSLVPLQYTPLPLELAWAKFQQTKMLQLGVDSRADWIANGILYIPAGFLVAEWLTGHMSRLFRIPAMLLAFAICAGLAFGIEFTQIFFPPRTVSQNDILAECIGSLFGITLAPYLGHWLRQLLAYRPASQSAGITLILSTYLLAYVAYSLFPYDFLISSDELTAKFNSNQWGILFAGSETGGRFFLTIVKLGIEVAAAIPFGIFLMRRTRPQGASPMKVIVPAALLGMAIEFAQLFIYTGSSQGISVATRILGSYAGAMLWLHGRHIDENTLKVLLKRSTGILLPVYLLGIAGLTGWFSLRWGSFDAAVVSFEKTKWLPFYYHYYTSEAHALTSLISVIAMFAPLGLFTWAWNWSRLSAALLAMTLAFIVETSRLFFADTHPDPTNLLLAAASACLVALFTSKLHAPIGPPLDEALPGSPDSPHLHTAPHSSSNGGQLIMLALVAGFSAYWLSQFPVQPILLAIALLACAVLAWFKPVTIVALIPAALPVLDLAPWSGRFFFDEFDILLMLTLTIGLLRTPSNAATQSRDSFLKLALGLLLLSYLISTLRALLPFPALDENSFNSYFSQFNALRISKGLIWAIAFVTLYRRIAAHTPAVFRWFAWGTTLGLALAVAIILREKIMFGGLLNVDTQYRATGPFSAIHTGGAFIEGYLAVAVPFLILLTVRTKSWLQRIAGSVLLLATTYALMMTISRNGFFAYAIAVLCALIATLAGPGSKWRRGSLIFVLGAASIVVAMPIFKGEFTQQRLSTISTDLGVRIDHWHNGLAMRTDDWLTGLLGMGVGRYPEIFYWTGDPKLQPSRHALSREGENTYLRLAPGNTLYVEQIITVSPNNRYRLSFDFRSPTPETTVGIALCEKWMLASADCATWQKTEAASEPNAWKTVALDIDTLAVGTGNWLTQRPVKLSLFTNNNGLFDIDNLSLRHTASGQEIIKNGRFDHGLDHWFFASDEHLAWHVKSLPVAVLFDQGWLGLLAFMLYLCPSLINAIRSTLAGNPAAGTQLAAMLGFLVVGIFDTLIDAPRFLLLLVFLPWLVTDRTATPPPTSS
jgi:VanZ family protein